jgi:Flp pilus assembly protein TadD
MNYLVKMVMLPLALTSPIMTTAQAPAPGSMKSQLVDQPPSETFPELAAVEALGRAGKVQEEEQAVRQLLAANPQRKEPWIYIGLRLMRTSPDSARQWFEKAAEIDPEDPYAQANLARIDAIGGQIDPARVRLNAADGKRPASVQLALARADVELVGKNPSGTVASIKKAQSYLVPPSERPTMYARLADAQMMLSNWPEALDALDNLLALEPNLPRRFQRANILVQLGRFADASAEYTALDASDLARDPQFAKALGERIAYLEQAASQALTINKTNHSEYYALVDAAELANNYSATDAFNCRSGAFVIALNEVRAQQSAAGLEGMLVAPLRKAGVAGVVGEATLSENLMNPLLPPSVFTISRISDADQESLLGRRSLKMCPAE